MKFKLSQLKVNPGNPRLIKDEKFKRLCKSIQDFPEMMALRPIIYDENNIILGGNMRYKALQELGMKEIPADWVKCVTELSEEKKKEFVIKDNNSFGEYDFDMLANEWDSLPLTDWGVDLLEAKKNVIDDLSGKIPAIYEIVIECNNETHQQELFEQLTELNIPCRLSTL